MWTLIIGNLHPAFQRYAGRKSPAELGMCRAYAVPGYCRICSQDTHRVCEAARQEANSQWVEKCFSRQETDSAIRDGVLGFCSSPSVILLISCQCHLRRQRWKKNGIFPLLLFPGKATLGRIPTTPWLYLTLAISSTAAACLTTTCWRDSDGKSPSVTRAEAEARYSGR